MSKIPDTVNRYGYGSILLHWIVAGFGLALTWTGYEFMLLPRGAEKSAALAAHLAAGWGFIILVIARVAWRLANPLPALASGPTWQRHAARTAHWSLLILIVGITISGYLGVTSGRRPVEVYGLFVAPSFTGPNGFVHGLSEDIHTWLSHIFVAILAVHVLAALKRSFMDNDGTLRRMLRVD